jgi:3-oxoacyl-[acyl-carrier-protein] synthase II
MQRRVVITGLGAISPLGNDVQSLWENIQEGVSGAGPITQFDAAEYKTRIAAEVKDFNPSEIFGKKDARRMDRFTQFALASAIQALEQANLSIDDQNRDRIGVVLGTGIGGIGALHEQLKLFNAKGPRRVSPFFVPMMMPDSGSAYIAIHFGLRGPNMAVVTACATGTNAVGEALEVIRRGDADVMVAGGSDATIIPLAMAGLNVMGAMTTRNDDPERASRPFDLNRDGFLIGEGSAVMVLEELEKALDRGAEILGELKGYGTTCDAFHISAPALNGEGAAKCMKLALENAGIAHNEIDYINAHGTSTQLNDRSETAAIKTVFRNDAYRIPVSSTKSMTGHLLGASGTLEAVICVKAINDSVLPPTINYEVPDPECDLDYVPNQARPQNIQNVMSNSFGFGGHNATIIISKYDGMPEKIG